MHSRRFARDLSLMKARQLARGTIGVLTLIILVLGITSAAGGGTSGCSPSSVSTVMLLGWIAVFVASVGLLTAGLGRWLLIGCGCVAVGFALAVGAISTVFGCLG